MGTTQRNRTRHKFTATDDHGNVFTMVWLPEQGNYLAHFALCCQPAPQYADLPFDDERRTPYDGIPVWSERPAVPTTYDEAAQSAAEILARAIAQSNANTI